MGAVATRLIAMEATQIRAFISIKKYIVIIAIKGEG
jgi:hypothetical protein